jgi:urease accessory protein
MKSVSHLVIAVTATLCLATPALAHPGHGEGLGLFHGFAHPFGDDDYILSMIAAGIVVAVLLGPRLLHLLRR